MRNRTLTGLLLGTALAMGLSACNGTGGTKPNGEGGNPKGYPRTVAGEKLLGGALVVESVTILPRKGGGQVNFVVRNASGEAQEDLSATIILYSPATSGVQTFDTEAVNHSFSVFRGESVTLSAPARDPEKVRGWVLRVEAGRTVKREGGSPGSTFLDGALECVDIQGDPTELVPRIEFTVENIGRKALDLIEFRVVFKKGGTTVTSTPWTLVEGPLAPGARTPLKPDISALDVGSAKASLQIRRGIL